MIFIKYFITIGLYRLILPPTLPHKYIFSNDHVFEHLNKLITYLNDMFSHKLTDIRENLE